MKNLKFFLSATALYLPCILVNAQNTSEKPSDQLERTLHARDSSIYIYPTRFGDLRFVNGVGEPGSPANKILLNGKVLLSMEGVVDKQGFELSLMADLFVNPTQNAPRKPGQTGHREVYKMIVSIGPDGNCIKRFVIIDLTGAKPFLSKPFPDNPDDRFCQRLAKVKWGNNESYIDLAGPERYLYRTNGDVIGPIDN